MNNAAFFTVDKPCEQALADLTEAYNKLADQVEEAWATIAEIELERDDDDRPHLLPRRLLWERVRAAERRVEALS